MNTQNKIVHFLFIVALFAFIQCSPKYRKETLSVFFDGVPDSSTVEMKRVEIPPNGVAAIKADSLVTANPIESKFQLHKPYQNHECEKCHDGTNMNAFIKPELELCLSCHESYAKKYAYLHGPVSAGYCTQCHHPHMSENKHLLTRINESLCYNCHNSTEILKNKSHQVSDVNACTKCHNPHGGKDHYMIN
jgi:predicted CXXCH cytochrome family protein